MFDESPAELVAPLRAAVDGLLGARLSALCGPELIELLRGVEAQTRRLAAVDAQLIAEIDDRHLAGDVGTRDTATLLGEALMLNTQDARRRVDAARELAPRVTTSGQVLEPLCPVTSAALAAGRISAAHARLIAGVLDRIPPQHGVEFVRDIEACLVEHAESLRPAQLARAGERLLARLDPDGAEPTDREHQRRRSVTLRKNADGSAELSGFLTPAAAAVWDAIFDALAAPAPAEDGTRDLRSPAQRRHDALLDGGQRLLNSGTLPDCGGTAVSVVVTIDEQTLREQTGYATTAHGDPISVAELLSLAAEAEIIPVVLDDAGGILAYGRTRRTASPAQRRALAARDRGCSFPGCTRPPSWTQAHHIWAWLDGGPTDLDNLTLVCGYHHREFARQGWDCEMICGVPHWRPPSWLDRERRPRRNTAHHAEISFDLPVAA